MWDGCGMGQKTTNYIFVQIQIREQGFLFCFSTLFHIVTQVLLKQFLREYFMRGLIITIVQFGADLHIILDLVNLNVVSWGDCGALVAVSSLSLWVLF